MPVHSYRGVPAIVLLQPSLSCTALLITLTWFSLSSRYPDCRPTCAGNAHKLCWRHAAVLLLGVFDVGVLLQKPSAASWAARKPGAGQRPPCTDSVLASLCCHMPCSTSTSTSTNSFMRLNCCPPSAGCMGEPKPCATVMHCKAPSGCLTRACCSVQRQTEWGVGHDGLAGAPAATQLPVQPHNHAWCSMVVESIQQGINSQVDPAHTFISYSHCSVCKATYALSYIRQILTLERHGSLLSPLLHESKQQ